MLFLFLYVKYQSAVREKKVRVLFLTVHIASLFGDLPLNGVVYRCDWRRGWRWGLSGRSHWRWWYVGFVRGLSCWQERLVSWQGWLGWRRGHPPGRQRGFGRCCGW